MEMSMAANVSRFPLLGFFLMAALSPNASFGQTTNANPPAAVQKIIRYYSDYVNYENNRFLSKSGSTVVYDDGKNDKSYIDMIERPDVEDQFTFTYPIPSKKAIRYDDPGRIRNDTFFRMIYGPTKEAVEENLTTIEWCPRFNGGTIRVTRILGIDQKLQAISAELESHPEWTDWLKGGAIAYDASPKKSWNRAPHNLGYSIDLLIPGKHHWQTECGCSHENAVLKGGDRLPNELIAIFEKNGFIWGGNWYHYESLHFEYRPELLPDQPVR
jgi:hypothetical protein